MCKKAWILAQFIVRGCSILDSVLRIKDLYII
jgi:hypothetical protein